PEQLHTAANLDSLQPQRARQRRVGQLEVAEHAGSPRGERVAIRVADAGIPSTKIAADPHVGETYVTVRLETGGLEIAVDTTAVQVDSAVIVRFGLAARNTDPRPRQAERARDIRVDHAERTGRLQPVAELDVTVHPESVGHERGMRIDRRIARLPCLHSNRPGVVQSEIGTAQHNITVYSGVGEQQHSTGAEPFPGRLPAVCVHFTHEASPDMKRSEERRVGKAYR